MSARARSGSLVGRLPGAEYEGPNVRQVEGAAWFPTFEVGDLEFLGAVRPHPPKVHFSVGLPSEQHPLSGETETSAA